jgi:hypothetical protein
MPSDSPATETPAAWPLRAWFIAEVLFALSSSSAVFLSPQATATNFAWPIQPVVTAALFGAIYFCALLLMTAGFFIRVWERVRVIVLPSAVFTLAMLLPTFLHLDRFATGSISFAIWLASYVLPPPVFVACYLWQQKQSQPVGSGGHRAVPGPRADVSVRQWRGTGDPVDCGDEFPRGPAGGCAVHLHATHRPRPGRLSHAGSLASDFDGI